MAKTNNLVVSNKGKSINLLNSTEKLNWNIFNNTPSSLVSGTGHNHDNLYYRTPVINSLFKTETDKLSILSNRIVTLGIKSNILMGGGSNFNDNKLRNYAINTEANSVINTTTNFNISKGSGLSFQRFGYFLNDAKKIDKYDHFTTSIKSITDTPIIVKNTLIDYAVQSKGYIFNDTNAYEINILLNTYKARPDVITNGNFRIGLSSFTFGFTKGISNSTADSLKKYSYSAGSIEILSTFNPNGDVGALQKNNNIGFWIGSNSFKQNYISNSISQIVGINNQNSNNTSNDIFGIIQSGNNATTSYKLTYSNESISVANNNTDTTFSSYIEI